MRPVLVTGGCGFIGSNFIHYLLETDPEARIINLDALTYAGNLDNLAAVADNPHYRFIHGDITDRAAVRRVVGDGVCAIINFAAESHVDRSIHDSGPFARTNVIGTQALLDAAREFKLERYV
ncbi:MAG TPA: GDP-mannose 4,6-dehydratase, partial [Gemmataceae bacterium]|nr:GDP-mannose 4,6-dehydratase [Gemmataceae bacterium]